MSYSHSLAKINHDYYIIDEKLAEINTIRDLRVTFQPNLSFYTNIDQSCTKALKTLVF